MWSNPKRKTGVTAKHTSVQQVFSDAKKLEKILSFIECELPLTHFEENAVAEFHHSKWHQWDTNLYTPTEVCWYWYGNWFPTNFCRRALSLSHYQDTFNDVRKRIKQVPTNLWERLNDLCYSLLIPPYQIVPMPDENILTRLHIIDMDSVTKDRDYPYSIPFYAPWLNSVSVNTQTLVHLQKYQNLHTLKLSVDNNAQMVQLSKLTQLTNLDLNQYRFDDYQWDVDLSPLQTLTKIQYLRLRFSVKTGLSGWLHNLTQLQVLETYDARKALGSMHMFTSLRRYCVDSITCENYTDCIGIIRRLTRVICNLLTLPPNSDVDIHLPIVPWLFSCLYADNDQDEECRKLCESFRKLMRRFGLGFRAIKSDKAEEDEDEDDYGPKFYTFAPRRWPTLPDDITDPYMVDHYVLRLCGIGVCSRCHDKYWHPDCKNCLSCNVFQTPADSQSKWEWERRVRARLTK